MLQRWLLAAVNIVNMLTPTTRWFGVRRVAYRISGVSVGEGVRICGRSVVQYPNVSIGPGTWIGARTEMISTPDARIRIGANCDISEDVIICCGSHVLGNASRRAGEPSSRSITIGDGSWIGLRATILGGVSIGEGSVIAAGALVRDSCPPDSVLAGVPAKLVRTLAE
ncbi:acyltransferase [Desertimonas flava]|uniref:acyltransferase n=1 Tax=Desertimonas flava TaxID=2064846 RepID=UPI000E34B30C